MDLIALAEQVFPQAAGLAANVTPSQYTNRTPCSEWDVHALLNHMVSTHHLFAELLADQVPAEPLDMVGDDPGTAYANAIKLSLEAFRQPGALDKTITLPSGPTPGSMALGMLIMDNIVHGWDLAQGTGQEQPIDDQLAAGYLEQMRGMPFPRQPDPGAIFAQPVPIADDAPASKQLLAFLGRNPG